MIQKIDDIYINHLDKTIEQKINWGLFSLSIIIVLMIILGSLTLYFYVDEMNSLVYTLPIVFVGFVIAFSPQFINNTKIILKNNSVTVEKSYFFGLHLKKESIRKESIILTEEITKEYDETLSKETGEQIRYWIASSEYSKINIIRLRNQENFNSLKKSISSVLEKEIDFKRIILERFKSNKFIN